MAIKEHQTVYILQEFSIRGHNMNSTTLYYMVAESLRVPSVFWLHRAICCTLPQNSHSCYTIINTEDAITNQSIKDQSYGTYVQQLDMFVPAHVKKYWTQSKRVSGVLRSYSYKWHLISLIKLVSAGLRCRVFPEEMLHSAISSLIRGNNLSFYI